MTTDQLLRYIDAVQKNVDFVKKEELIEMLVESAKRIQEQTNIIKQQRDEINALTLDVAFLDKRIG